MGREPMRVILIATELSVVARAVTDLHSYGICTTCAPHLAPDPDIRLVKTFDAVLFDVQLVKSVSLAEHSTPEFLQCCSLALTTSADPLYRSTWLNVGADDCVTVPCSIEELAAKIAARIRCRRLAAHALNQHTLRAGNLSLSLETMNAYVDGIRIALTAYEFALLWVLARNCGKVLSREQLLEQAKGSAEDTFDRSIDVQVSRLRNKLGDDPRQPRLLKTIRGAGYMLAPE